MATEPVLDLSTLIADRPPIRINGRTYHLFSPEELTLAQSHQFTRWGKELQALSGNPEKLAPVLRVVARQALADVPKKVFNKLSSSQHLAIVEVFTVLLLGRRARQAGALVGARSTGPSTSRGSSAPMAATPAGGSTAPPPPSSGPM